MRDYIDENDKKNEIRLLFRHPLYRDKIIIVVEGQSDVRLFRNILENENIKLETMDGKQQLLNAMVDLIAEYPKRILAICDADHDHLLECAEDRKKYSIYTTDHHDAEIMILNSPALKSFVHEYSSFDNADSICSGILENSFSAAYTIGLLRWINCKENLNIRFKGLNFNTFIDVDKLDISLNIEFLIDALLIRSSNKSDIVTKDYLIEMLTEYKDKNACKMQVCSGHDVTNIIAIVFRQRWASLDLNMDARKVESSLRVAFHKSYFNDTELFKNISADLKVSGINL
jgi:hypothetical protein